MYNSVINVVEDLLSRYSYFQTLQSRVGEAAGNGVLSCNILVFQLGSWRWQLEICGVNLNIQYMIAYDEQTKTHYREIVFREKVSYACGTCAERDLANCDICGYQTEPPCSFCEAYSFFTRACSVIINLQLLGSGPHGCLGKCR